MDSKVEMDRESNSRADDINVVQYSVCISHLSPISAVFWPMFGVSGWNDTSTFVERWSANKKLVINKNTSLI